MAVLLSLLRVNVHPLNNIVTMFIFCSFHRIKIVNNLKYLRPPNIFCEVQNLI